MDLEDRWLRGHGHAKTADRPRPRYASARWTVKPACTSRASAT